MGACRPSLYHRTNCSSALISDISHGSKTSSPSTAITSDVTSKIQKNFIVKIIHQIPDTCIVKFREQNSQWKSEKVFKVNVDGTIIIS